ncbi:MAG: acyl-CoA dehydrogenase family protein [Novosphingobium sp.]
MTYRAPLRRQLLAYDISRNLVGQDFPAPDRDLVEAVISETARFAETIFAPLDVTGDRSGARFADGEVTLPTGFQEAYDAYVGAGWASLTAADDFGGQAMPFAVSAIMQEQFSSANLAFTLCMMLSQGAIAAIEAHASPHLKSLYLPPLVEGRWTGTMNLTEPQAGSDLSQLRARAVPAGKNAYFITGTKIFITWGEHDLAENIVHLVLARLPDAPPGTKGISLFLVPKFLPDDRGHPGKRNDVRCVSIEHKLGIHASPTCTMSFGDEGRCIGWLVGKPNAGLAAMFTMMNHARINVGLQGVGIAEIACQRATAFARERIQSPVHGALSRDAVPIVEHADVRRMLMTMRALTDAARAIAYFNAAAVDAAHLGGNEAQRAAAQGRADLVTPVTKAFSTDIGVEVASLAIQVFGGMGFIEETGVARHYRDVRITPIYEGTNGIQALDLVGRKLKVAGGEHCQALLNDMQRWLAVLSEGSFASEASILQIALEELRDTSTLLKKAGAWDAAAAATPYLRQFALVLGGTLLLVQASHRMGRVADGASDLPVEHSGISVARFFVGHLLPQAAGFAASVRAAGGLLAGPADTLFPSEG